MRKLVVILAVALALVTFIRDLPSTRGSKGLAPGDATPAVLP